MKHIRLFSTVSERTSVVNDHPYDNILSYTKENSGLLISRSMPNDEIWYISSNGNVVTPNSSDGFGANIVSNTYINGKGVIKFDGSVTSIVNNAFSNCTNLVTVTIPDSVTSIEDGVFNGCSSLTSVTIPDGVTSIGAGTFKGCSSLTSVTIPDGVTSIGDYAFFQCIGITSVTIPDSVTSIGERAFRYCAHLTSITCEPTTPPTISSGVFNNTNNCPIYVPAASVDTYKAANKWSSLASRIQAIQS